MMWKVIEPCLPTFCRGCTSSNRNRDDLNQAEQCEEYKSIAQQIKDQFTSMRWTKQATHAHQQREAMRWDEAILGDTLEAIAERQALLDEMLGEDSDDSDEQASWANSDGEKKRSWMEWQR